MNKVIFKDLKHKRKIVSNNADGDDDDFVSLLFMSHFVYVCILSLAMAMIMIMIPDVDDLKIIFQSTHE